MLYAHTLYTTRHPSTHPPLELAECGPHTTPYLESARRGFALLTTASFGISHPQGLQVFTVQHVSLLLPELPISLLDSRSLTRNHFHNPEFSVRSVCK